MSVSKTFECPSCESEGKIVVRTEDVHLSDIGFCPVCGTSIYEDEDSEDD